MTAKPITIDTVDSQRLLQALVVALIRKLGGSVVVTNEELGDAAIGVLTGKALPAVKSGQREATYVVVEP